VSAAFQLVAGSLPLDFANTLDNRGDPEREKELLATYADLLAFLRQSDALSDGLARKLTARAAHEPRAASSILHRARILREAIYRVFAAIAEGHDPAPADLDLVNAQIAANTTRTRLQKSGDHFDYAWSGEADALDRVLWPIVRSTTDLLTSENLGRVRLCEDEKCRWAFLDTSRNRTRRWCDMKVCGNRAKVRRFYERQKDAH
jgi:predicted RNA-binding Zn ribbon-like protein